MTEYSGQSPVSHRAFEKSPLITPCQCSGSLEWAWAHPTCLQQEIKGSQSGSCPVCHYSFHVRTQLKTFRRWERLKITWAERRKILCSVTFHVIAITCVLWSLYVLIDRTAEEIAEGQLDWPFWTMLVVVAIGFTGSVGMYVQCKMYAKAVLALEDLQLGHLCSELPGRACVFIV